MKLLNEETGLSGREIIGSVQFRARNDGQKRFRDSEDVFRKSDIAKCFYEYPLKLMFPSHAAENSHCQWVYPVIFGGGLLGGDLVSMETDVGDHCSVLFTSQSFPKVYSNGGKGASVQKLHFQLGSHSLLAVLSDPVVCYDSAIFRNEQVVEMEDSSNLVYLDWFTAGRTARNERWAFHSMHTSLAVSVNGEPLLREAVELNNSPELKLEDTMGNYNIIGICVILGPQLLHFAQQILAQLNKRQTSPSQSVKDSIWTASPLTSKDGKESEPIGCIIRIAASNTTQAFRELDGLLSPLQPIFGGRPFENRF